MASEIPTLTVTVTLADGGELYEPGDTINIAWELDKTIGEEEFALWRSLTLFNGLYLIT